MNHKFTATLEIPLLCNQSVQTNPNPITNLFLALF